MNKKILSVIVSMVLVGLTLVSLGIFYFLYQSNLQALQEKEDAYAEVQDKKDAEAQKAADEEYQRRLEAYQEELDAYNQRKAEEKQKADEARSNGTFYPPSFEIPPTEPSVYAKIFATTDTLDYQDIEFQDQRDKLTSQFKSIVIIHSIIIAFIILFELGLLLVLPKRTNSHDINLEIRNGKE